MARENGILAENAGSSLLKSKPDSAGRLSFWAQSPIISSKGVRERSGL